MLQLIELNKTTKQKSRKCTLFIHVCHCLYGLLIWKRIRVLTFCYGRKTIEARNSILEKEYSMPDYALNTIWWSLSNIKNELAVYGNMIQSEQLH